MRKLTTDNFLLSRFIRLLSQKFFDLLFSFQLWSLLSHCLKLLNMFSLTFDKKIFSSFYGLSMKKLFLWLCAFLWIKSLSHLWSLIFKGFYLLKFFTIPKSLFIFIVALDHIFVKIKRLLFISHAQPREIFLIVQAICEVISSERKLAAQNKLTFCPKPALLSYTWHKTS